MRLPHAGFALAVSFSVCCAAQAQDVLWQWDGLSDNDELGRTVAGLGDVDFDGAPDVAAADYESGGTVRVFSGASGAEIYSFDDASGTSFGTDVCTAGDVNGDGHADIAISNMWVGRGAVYVYSGADGSLVWSDRVSSTWYEFQGYALGSVGDVDLDGVPDLAATALFDTYSSYCYARVFSGASGIELLKISASGTGGNFFNSIDGIGDLNGDGIADLLIGNAPCVDLFSGADGSLIREIAPSRSLSFGWSARSIDDLDGDGLRDVVVGDWNPYIPGGADAVHLISSGTGKVLAKFTGPIRSGFGMTVAPAGDVDGDGVVDLVIGAPTDKAGGFVELRSVATGRVLHRFRGLRDAGFAQCVDGVGDVDGDGFDDVVFGVPGWDGSGSDRGSAVVLGGDDLFLSVDPPMAQSGDVITLTAREGRTGDLVVIVLVDVGGTPAFTLVGGLGSFDAASSYSLSGVVPPGASGLSLSFVAFGDDASGRLRESGRADLLLK